MTVSPVFMRLAIMALMAVCLAGCGRSQSYRYKLTLAVNTPDGVKRGSSVAEMQYFEFSIPERGTSYKLNGEAIYLDLGPGRRPLIALLTSGLHRKYGKDQSWVADGGPTEQLLSQLYGVTYSPPMTLLGFVSQIARMRGAHEIATNDLPDLVTFADIYVPGA
jgi:hypothetical protein